MQRASCVSVWLCECVKLITHNQPLLKCKEELDWSVSQYVVKYMLTKGVELWVQTVCGSLFVNILLETLSLSEQCLTDSYMNINLTPSFLLHMTTAMADSFCTTSALLHHLSSQVWQLFISLSDLKSIQNLFLFKCPFSSHCYIIIKVDVKLRLRPFFISVM